MTSSQIKPVKEQYDIPLQEIEGVIRDQIMKELQAEHLYDDILPQEIEEVYQQQLLKEGTAYHNTQHKEEYYICDDVDTARKQLLHFFDRNKSQLKHNVKLIVNATPGTGKSTTTLKFLIDNKISAFYITPTIKAQEELYREFNRLAEEKGIELIKLDSFEKIHRLKNGYEAQCELSDKERSLYRIIKRTNSNLNYLIKKHLSNNPDCPFTKLKNEIRHLIKGKKPFICLLTFGYLFTDFPLMQLPKECLLVIDDIAEQKLIQKVSFTIEQLENLAEIVIEIAKEGKIGPIVAIKYCAWVYGLLWLFSFLEIRNSTLRKRGGYINMWEIPLETMISYGFLRACYELRKAGVSIPGYCVDYEEDRYKGLNFEVFYDVFRDKPLFYFATYGNSRTIYNWVVKNIDNLIRDVNTILLNNLLEKLENGEEISRMVMLDQDFIKNLSRNYYYSLYVIGDTLTFHQNIQLPNVPVIFLGANIDYDILRRKRFIKNSDITKICKIEVPPKCKIIQITDRLGSAQQIRSRYTKSDMFEWKERLPLFIHFAEYIGKKKIEKVGVICRKQLKCEDGEVLKLENLVKNYLEKMGYKVFTQHFGEVESRNTIHNERVDVLIILGVQIPNPQSIIECAYWLAGTDAKINEDNFDKKRFRKTKESPYTDFYLEKCFKKICVSELYQACHRGRPVIRDDIIIILDTYLKIPGISEYAEKVSIKDIKKVLAIKEAVEEVFKKRRYIPKTEFIEKVKREVGFNYNVPNDKKLLDKILQEEGIEERSIGSAHKKVLVKF